MQKHETEPSHSMYVTALSWLLLVTGIATALVRAPEQLRDLSQLQFIGSFLLVTAFLALASQGIGTLLRRSLIRSDFVYADIPLGFGALALLLSFYLKTTLNPYPFLVMLVFGAGTGLYTLWSRRLNILPHLRTPWAPLKFGCVLWILTALAIGNTAGFLFPPTDFDSGLFHVTFPKIVVARGEYFNPDWLRVPWHPQLTHSWYIYLLTLLDDRFLKCINALCFLQIALLFMICSAQRNLLSVAAFCLIGVSPEFSASITSTSLDAVLVLFLISAFAVFLHYFWSKPALSTLGLATALCGFAGGQKHFGLMFSAPLLTFAGLHYVLKTKPSHNVGPAGRCLHVAALAAAFSLLFIPFYLHNALAGNALLFPFLGSKINTWGWTEADLHEMLTSTIPHWGHRKDLWGYFTLPFDLLAFPGEYQFGRTHGIIDLLISAEMVLIGALVPIGLALRPLRSPRFFIPLLFLLVMVLLWYRASQVIRYLFPFLIISAFFLAYAAERLISVQWAFWIRPISIIASAVLLFVYRPPVNTIPPATKEQGKAFYAQISPLDRVYEWLSSRVGPDEQIITLASPANMHHFPNLRLCGDWFAKCSFGHLIDGMIHVRPWSELEPFVRARNARFIVISWNFFNASAARRPESEWGLVFPESTLTCLTHVLYDGAVTDVFEIKPSCRSKES